MSPLVYLSKPYWTAKTCYAYGEIITIQLKNMLRKKDYVELCGGKKQIEKFTN